MLGCECSLVVETDGVLVLVRGSESHVVERRERAERNLTFNLSKTSRSGLETLTDVAALWFFDRSPNETFQFEPFPSWSYRERASEFR
jgi:hypothetical protein